VAIKCFLFFLGQPVRQLSTVKIPRISETKNIVELKKAT
jgi:hypothetical protein